MNAEAAGTRIEAQWRVCSTELVARLADVRRRSGRDAIRRTRKAVRTLRFLFDGWRPEGPAKDVRRELRALARALGPARDAAVFERVLGRVARRARDERSAALRRATRELAGRAKERRRGLTWSVIECADGVLDRGLEGLLESCRWPLEGELAQPVSLVEPRAFRDEVRTIVDAGAGLRATDPEELRHAVRIHARAPLALAATFDLEEARRDGLAALTELRKQLGDLHDLEMARDRLNATRARESAALKTWRRDERVDRKALDAAHDFALERIAHWHATGLERARAEAPARIERIARLLEAPK